MQSFPQLFRNIFCMGSCVNGSRDQYSEISVQDLPHVGGNAGTAVL